MNPVPLCADWENSVIEHDWKNTGGYTLCILLETIQVFMQEKDIQALTV